MSAIRDRRRSARVSLSLPVTLYRGGAMAHLTMTPLIGQLRDLSATGAFVTLPPHEAVSLTDLFIIALVVPGNERQRVPFARISGSCRVVRLEPPQESSGSPATGGAGRRQGVALGFCEGELTMLGAVPSQEGTRVC